MLIESIHYYKCDWCESVAEESIEARDSGVVSYMPIKPPHWLARDIYDHPKGYSLRRVRLFCQDSCLTNFNKAIAEANQFYMNEAEKIEESWRQKLQDLIKVGREKTKSQKVKK